MLGKNKQKKETKSEESFYEPEFDDLDDIESPNLEEELSVEEQLQRRQEEFEGEVDERIRKLTSAIKTNQKYIKKCFEELKRIEENFNILLKEK